MGFFSDYGEETFKVNGKNICVHIDQKELIRISEEIIDELLDTLKRNRNIIDYLRIKKIRFRAFIKFIKEFIILCLEEICKDSFEFLPEKLDLYFKTVKSRTMKARYVEDISTDTAAFFEINSESLFSMALQEYFNNSKSIIDILKNCRLMQDSSIPELLRHEFTHHLDRHYVLIKEQIYSRLEKFFGGGNWQQNSFSDVSRLRSEGITRFLERSGHDYIEYYLSTASLFPELVKGYDGEGSILPSDLKSSVYECGLYMCYFIALVNLKKSDGKMFDSMDAIVNGEQIPFSYGFGYILNRKSNVIKLKNFGRKYCYGFAKYIFNLDHIRFIKEYESACTYLDIPEKQIIITLDWYKFIKRKAYQTWLARVEEKGFSVRGIKESE